MISVVSPALIVAGLNRIVGGGFTSGVDDGSGKWLLSDWLPGRAIYWVTPLIGVIAWIWVDWQLALAFTASYAVWRSCPHGRWIDLDNDASDPNRQGTAPTAFERIIIALSDGFDVVALFWRHLTIWPGLALVWLCGGSGWMALSGPIVAGTMAFSHVVAKRCFPENHHPCAEFMHGAIFGTLITITAMLA